MISLEQIKLLEQKVEQALKKITELQNEKAQLACENEELKIEAELLKEELERLAQDEEKIEQGILSVLDKLNNVEDTIRQTQEPSISSEESKNYEEALPASSNSQETVEAQVENNTQIETSYTPQEQQHTEAQTQQDIPQHENPVVEENTAPVQQGGMLHNAEQTQLDIF